MRRSGHILRSRTHKITGFTLIEVLLALFITAVLASILAFVFNTGLSAYRRSKDLLEITRKAQLVLGQMTRDMAGAVVQEAGGTTYIPFEGNLNSVFFMAPVDNASAVDLCEIGYVYDNVKNELNRHFVTADASSFYQYPSQVTYITETSAQKLFCDNVSGFDLAYHNGTSWPGTVPGSTSTLPRMVEVRLQVQGTYGVTPQTKTFITWIYLQNSQ